MKLLYNGVLATYVVALLWLVLFKTSFDLIGVFEYQQRSFNLVPFVGESARGAFDNFLVFIPLGLLVSVVWKNVSLSRRLAAICLGSCIVEILQFVCAIGATDITDVLTNTAGGFVGLAAYDRAKKRGNTDVLDRCICSAVLMLLMLSLLVRVFVFEVRY